MIALQRIRCQLLHDFIDASIRSFADQKIQVKWATFWHHQTAFASQLAHLLPSVRAHVRLNIKIVTSKNLKLFSSIFNLTLANQNW